MKQKTYTVNNETHRVYLDKIMHKSWLKQLKPLVDSDYFAELTKLIKNIYEDVDLDGLVEPIAPEDIFAPLSNIHIDDVKVILIGGSPKRKSNGLLYGSDYFEIESYNEDMIKHTEFFDKINPNYLLDTSLMDYCDSGILPLNICPLSIQGKDMFFLSSFRQYIANILHAVYTVNPNVVIASTHAGGISLIRAAAIPTKNVIISDGYFKVRNSDGQNIYEAINEKLEEPIEFWK